MTTPPRPEPQPTGPPAAERLVIERLVIAYADGEGALLRLLGLIERRGFDLARVAMRAGDDGRATLRVAVRPREPGRSIATLTRQIERLHGITQVSPDLSDIRSDIREEAA